MSSLQMISLLAAILFLLFSIFLAFRIRFLQDAMGQLVKTKERYFDLVHQANDAVLVVNIASGKIIESNFKAAKLLGYNQKQLVDSSIFDLHSKDRLHQSAQYIADAWEKDGFIYSDLPMLTSQGEEIDVECSTRVIDYGEEPAIVLYARDIRERLILEKQLAAQKSILEIQNEEIKASMRYARRIQDALLPNKSQVLNLFKNFHVHFEPRDIVGGDFLWVANRDQYQWLALGDCTGHGVPAGLLAAMGQTLLGDIINDRHILSPTQVLHHLRKRMIHLLQNSSDHEPSRDGMDIALCRINQERGEIVFSGAFSSMIIQKDDNSLLKIKGDRMPIGHHPNENKSFTEQKISYSGNARLFLFSDGLVDQFGGPKGKKFKFVNLEKCLSDASHQTEEVQFKSVVNALNNWKQGYDQTDDILFAEFEF